MTLEDYYGSAVKLFLKEWRNAQTTEDKEKAFSAFFIHATELERTEEANRKGLGKK